MNELTVYSPSRIVGFEQSGFQFLNALATPFLELASKPQRPRYGMRSAYRSTPSTITKFGLIKEAFDFSEGLRTRGTLTPATAADFQSDSQLAVADAPRAGDAQSTMDEVASQRVTLLAIKYAQGEQAKEVLARLDILNQRLLEQAPRVTMEHVVFLEQSAQLVADSDARRVRLEKLLGI